MWHSCEFSDTAWSDQMNDLLTNADVTRERVKLRSVSCVKRKTLHPGLKAINLVTDESEEKKSWAFFKTHWWWSLIMHAYIWASAWQRVQRNNTETQLLLLSFAIGRMTNRGILKTCYCAANYSGPLFLCLRSGTAQTKEGFIAHRT